MSPARVVLVALLFTIAACKKDSNKSTSAAKPADGKGKVAIVVDGQQVAAVDPGSAATYPPIAALLPSGKQNMDTWASVAVTTTDGATQTVNDPSTSQQGKVAGFFPGRTGIGFGFYLPADLAKKGDPSWQVQGVATVTIATKGADAASAGSGGGNGEGGGANQDSARPQPTADLKITIATAGGDIVFSGDKLAGLPVAHAPVGDTDTPGWRLNDIIAAAGVKTPTGQVVVDGGEDANLVLDPADWDTSKAMLFIKLNRSGQLRFRRFEKNGDAWDLAGELRGLDRIEIK